MIFWFAAYSGVDPGGGLGRGTGRDNDNLVFGVISSSSWSFFTVLFLFYFLFEL